MRSAQTILRSIIYIVLGLTLVALAWFLPPAKVHYHVTEQYIFNSQQAGAQVSLGVLLPRSGPYQTVKNLAITWQGDQETIAHTDVDELRLEGGLQTANIEYDVTLFQGPAHWDAPVSDAMLQPQENVEAADPVLAELANSLAEGQSRQDAYRLFEFTAQALDWPQGSRVNVTPSARQAYEAGIGGCEEFANLYTALARAAGIPARSMAGLAMPLGFPPFWSASATWNSPAGAHAWNEVYVDGAWEFADASWASSSPLRQLYFGRTDGAHLSYGENGELNAIYQAMQAWAEGRGELSAAMSAPLHFAASADTPGVEVVPGIEIKKGWDGRWVAAVAVYILFLVACRLIENHLKKRSPGQPAS